MDSQHKTRFPSQGERWSASTCCSRDNKKYLEVCLSAHLSTLRWRRKNSPLQTWLPVIIRLPASKLGIQPEWRLNLTELFSFPSSLIQNTGHAALRRLPRDTIWPAAREAAGYRAQSNEVVTLHRRKESNGKFPKHGATCLSENIKSCDAFWW